MRIQKPSIPSNGVVVATLGNKPTNAVSDSLFSAKENKVEIAGAFEDAAHQAAGSLKGRGTGRTSQQSDSHDRPFEIKRSRYHGIRSASKAGLLADTFLVSKTVIGFDQPEIVTEFDPRPASVVIEEKIGMAPAAIDALGEQSTTARFASRPDLIRDPWAGYQPTPAGTTKG